MASCTARVHLYVRCFKTRCIYYWLDVKGQIGPIKHVLHEAMFRRTSSSQTALANLWILRKLAARFARYTRERNGDQLVNRVT